MSASIAASRCDRRSRSRSEVRSGTVYTSGSSKLAHLSTVGGQGYHSRRIVRGAGMSASGTSMNGAGGSRWLTYENGILLLLGTNFGLVFFDRNTINYLAADIVADLGLSAAQLGWLSSGLSLAWAVSAYVVGAWSDRRGTRKPFVLGSIIVFSLCSSISGFATSFA